METYSTAPETLRFKTVEEFEDKIEKILRKKNKYRQNIHKLRQIGEDRILEIDKNIGSHIEALTTPFGSDERQFLKQWN